MFKKLGLYYRTIKHLKPIQIRFRLWYILRDKLRNLTGHTYPFSIPKEGYRLNLLNGCPSPVAYCRPDNTFTFLNQSHTFEGAINWNFSKYGKLWAYNLNYFDYLHQPDLNKEEGLALIREFIDQMDTNTEGLEPYPISLRGINWIKFLTQHDIQDREIDASLYALYQILLDNLEYHLLGNHLLENGCSLLVGACYFRDEELYEKAKEILNNELEEQILGDGGHFERSTMYHCILLERLLDCYNAVRGSEWARDGELDGILRQKVELMLGWLEQMTVDRRSSPVTRQLPLLNDGAKGIAPSSEDLFEYADRLKIKAKPLQLSESGYRRFSKEPFDLICDVGAVGPDYQPGHAHSDTFSFVLYHQGKPMIIDPGISTYENNERRQRERSTAFHNTVQFEDQEQSEVWCAFRVGRRALVDIEVDVEKELKASHDGYRPWGIRHERSWKVKGDTLYIEDRLTGKAEAEGTFFVHFHPEWEGRLRLQENSIIVGGIEITFEGAESVKRYSYECPDGYNRYVKASKVKVMFTGRLTTRIGKMTG